MKVRIKVTVTREIELNPEIYEDGATPVQMLQQEVRYASDLFHEWCDAEDVKWEIDGQLIDEKELQNRGNVG